ncbi:hypothetical protein [Paraflavitalea speifideaquila]|uniref:hypothetical protein n=1 Tax=Paraflavitalea speifideaquila TaxID=3076558 RepID=UPI0028E87488|nr:hypothetical protein [Paraflavitalea speifideiaquila]
MNSRIITVGISLAVSFTALAQPARRTLDWKDFTKSISETIIAKPVRTNEFTIFEITNINKFLYKVEMQGKVFELQTPIPTELQTLFRLNPTELANTVNSKNADEAVGKISEQVPAMQKIAGSPQAKAAVGNTTEQNEAAENFQKSLDEVVEKCLKYLDKSIAMAGYIFDLRKVRNEFISIAQMDLPFADIQTKTDAAAAQIPTVDIKTKYFELKKIYHDVEALYQDAAAKAEEANATADQKKKINNAVKEIEKADELIDEEGLLGLLDEVNFLNDELRNKKNFLAVAPPVQMDGDFVSYAVTITPTYTKTVGAHKNPVNFKFDIPAKGGWKADFSVGPVVSFGSNAKDETYYLKENAGTDSVTLEKRDNNNSISPGVGAMMHFYPRTGKDYALGLMCGVGAGFQSVSDVNFSLYAGGSVILGKRQKIIGSLGVSYLRVERLKSPEFKDGSKYAPAKITIADVTEKVFKPSFFLSISYNLTNRVDIN